jgi:hypothetical protein
VSVCMRRAQNQALFYLFRGPGLASGISAS